MIKASKRMLFLMKGNMRSPSRLKQKVWFSNVEEILDGYDTIQKYGKPFMKMLTISATAGTPEEISAGIVPTYDRYITSYDKELYALIKEGMAVWVDREPQLELDGSLKLDSNEIPLSPPDYVVKKILSSQKSKVSRYGISKIGGFE